MHTAPTNANRVNIVIQTQQPMEFWTFCSANKPEDLNLVFWRRPVTFSGILVLSVSFDFGKMSEKWLVHSQQVLLWDSDTGVSGWLWLTGFKQTLAEPYPFPVLCTLDRKSSSPILSMKRWNQFPSVPLL